METPGLGAEISWLAPTPWFLELTVDFVTAQNEVSLGVPVSETSGVEDFWDHMGGENPHSFAFAGSHPSGPERYLLVRATHREIGAKLAEGEELATNLQEKGWASGGFGDGGAAAPGPRMADER